jgi:hypothetical protein
MQNTGFYGLHGLPFLCSLACLNNTLIDRIGQLGTAIIAAADYPTKLTLRKLGFQLAQVRFGRCRIGKNRKAGRPP